MRRILLAFLAVAIAAPLFAQNPDYLDRKKEVFTEAKKGYYIKDSVVHFAYIYIEESVLSSKRVFIPAQQDHPEAVLLPEDISVFGFATGERYISVPMETETGHEWCFMEEMQKMGDGSSLLYFSPREAYYLLRDGGVSAMGTKNEPQPVWDFFYSVNEWGGSVKYPSKLRKGMVKRYYNAFAQCNGKMFPRTRFGITASVGTGKPKIVDKTLIYDTDEGNRLKKAFFLYDMSFSVGVFFRIPVDEVVSFQGEMTYFHISTSGDPETNEYGYVKYTGNSLRLPMLFRFTNNYSRRNLMPYGEIGPCFDFNFGGYSGKGGSINGSAPFFAVGAALGGGAEYYINPRRAAYLGARFSIVANRQRNYKYNLKAFEIVAGFSL